MSTTHNPVNFEPSHYEIVGYFDNRRPRLPFLGFCSEEGRKALLERHQREVEAWQAERDRLFPNHNDHQCQHCGQSNVRYVVSAKHLPTGERICFGDICCERLDLPNHSVFAARYIRSAAALLEKKREVEAKVEKFVESHPELKIIADNFDRYSKNTFISDVINRLRQHGSISDRQVEAVVRSAKRDDEFAAKKQHELSQAQASGAEPVKGGRYEVFGEVTTLKTFDSGFGSSVKMLIKSGFSKFWCTVPSTLSGIKLNDSVRLTADWSPSPKDPFFAFGKRPSKAVWIPAKLA